MLTVSALKPKFAAALLSILPAMSLYGGQPEQTGAGAADYFSRAPLEIVSHIPDYARLDMIDYFTHGSVVQTSNRLGAKLSIRSLDDNVLVYQDEDSVVTTIAVLPGVKADTTLMVIRTLSRPMPDSRVSFYDTAWHKRAGKAYPSPAMSDWLKSGVKLPIDPQEIPFVLSVASYDAENRRLTFKNVTAEFFADSDRPASLDGLKPELVFVWNGKDFRLL